MDMGMNMKMSSDKMMSGADMMLQMMRKRFWTAIVLCSPLLFLAIMKDVLHQLPYLSEVAMMWLQLLISIPVVFWCGWSFFVKAGRALVKGHLNMFTLVVMGVLSAWGYSVAAMFFPEYFPSSFHLADGSLVVYFDTSCYITIIVLLGHVWEMKGRKLISDDLAKVQKNDERLHPHLENVLSKVNMEPLKIQQYIDKVAEYFILFVILLALTTFFVWLKWGPAPSALYGLIIAITVLLSACPCVFTLATPLSIMCGINKSAQKGILVKNPDVFWDLAKVNHLGYKKNLSSFSALANLNFGQGGKSIKFALGTGDAKAIEEADVILLNGDINDISQAIELARMTMKNIKENLLIGLIYNVVMLPIAAGLLYPYWGIMLNPVTASFAMSASSIVVVGNALRIKLMPQN